ncbi:hypothetical protein [Nonomuraea jiangxiensis]|uniref:Peptidase inhibitor family I36 n=1 Tax=Nonomuraea jiangxiensis TaxID=633440 RepID=A0A1G9JPG5_9ACTN|nr:hypothetical protein [Nonomuraea jiangxiensis]SDL39341.1 hypothetical protein SAMN05421869_125109 [Nonomuraea jiangxiensis]
MATAIVAAMAATASATTSGAAPAPECQIVLGPAPEPGKASPVLSRNCAAQGERLVAPAADTLLMVWYESFNYGGASTKVYGSGGPCDTGGYGIAYVGDDWNDRISSYKVFNNCNYSATFQHANWGGLCFEAYGTLPQRAPITSSLWISSGSFAWDLCD